MALSVNDLVLLRRMCADMSDTPQFADGELTAIAERYPLSGENQYDLNAAARDAWELKAAALTEAEESFSSDGKQFAYGDLLAKALRMAAHYSAKADAQYSDYGYARSERADVDPLGEGSAL